MPELPDVDVYVAALHARVTGATLEQARLNSPFLLRTVTPSLATANGKRVTGVRRLGKRVVIALEDDLFLAIHLMIAGRLHWKPRGTKLAGKIALAALDFTTGTLTLTETGTKKRALTDPAIAWTYRIALYDAAYVAVAERLGSPLLTADEVMAKKMKGHSIVVRLADVEFE